jgi:hypothetical protein
MSQSDKNSFSSSVIVEPSEIRSQTSERSARKPRRFPIGIGVARILAFFLLIAALTLLTDRIINTGLRSVQTSTYGVLNRIVSGQANADIVISGSSRAWVHYDPREISSATGMSVFNIGQNGTQSDIQLAMLKTYLKHNRKPKLIIHNLDLYSLQTSKEVYEVARYIPYLKEQPLYETLQKVYPHASRWKALPLYGHLVEDARFNWLIGLKAFVGMQPREDHIEGFVPRHLHWTGDFEKFKEQNPEGVRFEMTSEGTKCIEEIAEICRSEGVPLLFAYSPEYKPMQEIEVNRREIFDQFRDIAARYDVPLWDFSDSPVCLDRDLFYNSQHLNHQGASQFSRELALRLAAGIREKIIKTGM